ncbi:MAG: gamma-glutamyl-gamma-aminobutyrate hydrolase family protein [Gammaproteobacteria bacterium]|nr:gamma-glutamyl-gamma-aminobutyrate hydrolase family protein [Gammaproteobacteria bacterium]
MTTAPYAPTIGITTYGRDASNRFDCPAEYVDAVRRAGGVPMLLPPGEGDWTDVARRLDGLLLTGGGDINPARYGGAAHPSIYAVDDQRDAAECTLMRSAINTGLPTLAICRGMQILNVVLGGTLHAHVPDAFGEQVRHRVPPREPVQHRVSVQPGSHLASLLEIREFDCASWHHQALDSIAAGLQISAYAPDMLIEAVELSDHPFLVAVQWHPELSAASDPLQQRLFDHLVATARNAGGSPRR